MCNFHIFVLQNCCSIYFISFYLIAPLSKPKLVLDLTTKEGCKAELTCVVNPKIVYLRKTVTNHRAVRVITGNRIETEIA